MKPEKKRSDGEMARFLRHLADLVEHENKELVDFAVIARFNDEENDRYLVDSAAIFCPDKYILKAIEDFVASKTRKLENLHKEDEELWLVELPGGSYPYHEN